MRWRVGAPEVQILAQISAVAGTTHRPGSSKQQDERQLLRPRKRVKRYLPRQSQLQDTQTAALQHSYRKR